MMQQEESRYPYVQLAEREPFSVLGDQDYVYIKHSDGRIWDVGRMYGNAVAALVTWDGRFAVIVGCGIIICDLHRFGENIRDSESWDETPVIHLMANPSGVLDFDGIWQFESVEQVSANENSIEIRLATALTDVHVGVYSLNPQTFEFRPVPHCEPMP